MTDTQVDDVLWAARTGDLEVWNILKKELDVTAALASSNDSGNTALHYAAANGHLEFVTAKRLRAEEDQREHQRHAEKNLEEKDESEDARKAELAHHDEMQSERALWDVRE